MTRFYCENINVGTVELAGDEGRHLVSVMRLGPGDVVELFDGKGNLATATVISTTRKSAQLTVENIHTIEPRTSARIIIAASIAKGQRFDWMISKCTELGADHIAPIICQRTVKLAKGTKAIQRYNKLALSAAKQCKRIFLPVITEPDNIDIAVDKLKEMYPDAKIIYGSLSENPVSILNAISPQEDVIAVVGPEGGFTAEEEKMLNDKQATAVKITQTVLRTETAATAITSIVATSRDNQ
jgi:16S rRNA (uracil1498-N3)-methyltransferase